MTSSGVILAITARTPPEDTSSITRSNSSSLLSRKLHTAFCRPSGEVSGLYAMAQSILIGTPLTVLVMSSDTFAVRTQRSKYLAFWMKGTTTLPPARFIFGLPFLSVAPTPETTRASLPLAVLIIEKSSITTATITAIPITIGKSNSNI